MEKLHYANFITTVLTNKYSSIKIGSIIGKLKDEITHKNTHLIDLNRKKKKQTQINQNKIRNKNSL